MEAAKIKPDSPSTARNLFLLVLMITMIIAFGFKFSFSQVTHEVGLNDNYIAGVSSVDPVTAPEVITGIKVYHNTPATSNSSVIKFENGSFTNLKLSVYDKDGNLVKAYLYDNIKPGVHEVNVDTSELSAGKYTYRFTSGNFSQSYKMNIVK